MIGDNCADQIRRVLGDRAFQQATRREHAAAVIAAVEHLQIDGFVRAWLLGHAAELASELAEAGQHYESAVRIANQHDCLAAAMMRGWLQLFLQSVRARRGEPFEVEIEHPVIPPACVDPRGAALLTAQLAVSRAQIVLDRPGTTPTHQELQHISAALDEATLAADAQLEAAQRSPGEERGWTILTTAEPFGQLYLQALRALIRGDRAGAIPCGSARAWTWFRELRRSIDLLPAEPTTPAKLPAETTVLEFLALPGEPLHLRLSGPWGSDDACSTMTVGQAADLQYALGERLREIFVPDAAMETRIAQAAINDSITALCEWTYDSAQAWSTQLVQPRLTWSSGKVGSLHERLLATRARRLCILPHGPMYILPWNLLRSAAGITWLETWQLTICPSWRSTPSTRDPARAVRVAKRKQPLRAQISSAPPDVRDATALFQEIAGVDRAWLSGHGLFVPTTHGESRLVTAGSQLLDFGLSALLNTAVNVQATPNRAPASIMLSICEAGEVSRRAHLTELVTLAHTFLVAGAVQVFAPKWSSTNILAPTIPSLLARHAPLAEIARDLLLKGYAPWRACRDRSEIAAQTRACLEQKALPLCDIGAFDLHGYL